MLERQIREIQPARHDQLVARWAKRGTCPFNLHRLIPIPNQIRQLGEEDPASTAWLMAHWGTIRLRALQIRQEGADRHLRRKAEIVYEFRSAEWTRWQTVLRLRYHWPKLVLIVQPRYDEA